MSVCHAWCLFWVMCEPSEPLWTDPGIKSGISELISTWKKKKKNASGEWMVKHFPQNLTIKEKATTTTSCVIFVGQVLCDICWSGPMWYLLVRSCVIFVGQVSRRWVRIVVGCHFFWLCSMSTITHSRRGDHTLTLCQMSPNWTCPCFGVGTTGSSLLMYNTCVCVCVCVYFGACMVHMCSFVILLWKKYTCVCLSRLLFYEFCKCKLHQITVAVSGFLLWPRFYCSWNFQQWLWTAMRWLWMGFWFFLNIFFFL